MAGSAAAAGQTDRLASASRRIVAGVRWSSAAALENQVREQFGALAGRAVQGQADGDAAPEAVADAQLAFDHQQDDVVRQSRPGRTAVPPAGGSVVSLDVRVGALMVRQPRERHAHIPTMRTTRTGRLMVFAGGAAMA